MTVPAAVTTYRYQGNGVTTIFAYSNRLLTTADVKVQILTRATDAIVETLTLTTDYTVTIVSNSLANITITNALKIPSGTQDILLTLDLAISQTRSYPRADSLPAADIERGLDKLTLIAQKLDDGQTLTVRFPVSDTTSDGELPAKADRASKYLAFDSNGDPIVTAGTDTITSAYGLTLVQAADAPAARTILGVQSVPYTAASASGPASLDFAEDTDNGTNKVTLQAPAALAADAVITTPAVTGTLATLAGTETFTNKSMTDPLISAQGGALILPQSTDPLPTTDGDIRWDSDDNRLVIGDGAGQQVFAPASSGTYTPTLTNVANVAASTASVCQWSRVGANVMVSGIVAIDPTSGGFTVTELGLSLPFASNFSAIQQCMGNATFSSVAAQTHAGSVLGDTTNDRARISFYANYTTNENCQFFFMYQILP